MKKTCRPRVTVLLLTVLLLAVSCSSQPKNPGDVISIRSSAEKELELGNKTASRGDYDIARELLRECRRKAIITDDISLLIRSSLSLGNVLLTLGQNDEAFAQFEQALAFAEKSGDRELLSVGRVYNARGKLLTKPSSAQDVLDEVTREAANIKSNRLYIAFSWQVRGQAHRELGSYAEAEAAFRQSLDIHVKDRSLENASYDWYTIASVRSLAGNTAGALEALEASIALDRRIENSWGLAANWRAMGDVYRRAGKQDDAKEAYQRARAIYSALGYEREAAEIDRRMAN